MHYRVSFDADAPSPKHALVIVVAMFKNPPPAHVVFDWLVEEVPTGQKYNCKASIQNICDGELKRITATAEA